MLVARVGTSISTTASFNPIVAAMIDSVTVGIPSPTTPLTSPPARKATATNAAMVRSGTR